MSSNSFAISFCRSADGTLALVCANPDVADVTNSKATRQTRNSHRQEPVRCGKVMRKISSSVVRIAYSEFIGSEREANTFKN